MKSEKRNCQNCKSEFLIEPDDFGFYEKMQVPPPTFCYPCRFQRRLTFMNERALYKDVCDMCGKNIISIYSPDKDRIVYCYKCYWSDKWDGLKCGRAYDPNVPFLKQLHELDKAVPHMPLETQESTLVNSEYINHAATSRNCYLIYTADECDNVLYSEILAYVKDSMDCTWLNSSELCYEGVNCARDSRVFFSDECVDSTDIYFSRMLRGCNNCFGCANLRKKSYYIFNQPYSKEEYLKKIKEMRLNTRSGIEEWGKKAREFTLTKPRKFMQSGSKSVNVSGEMVVQSKNSHDMFFVRGAEDCRFCQILTMNPSKDCYDYTIWGNNAQRVYEGMVVGEGADTIKFCYGVWPNVLDVEYSMRIFSSSHIFGCSGLNRKNFCILNKRYSESEYLELKQRIIKDMAENPYLDAQDKVYKYGEFFPSEMSPFAYNESYAMDFFPLSKNEALSRGYRWRDPDQSPYQATVLGSDLPNDINDVKDDILQQIIECAKCKRPFKMVPMELQLLRKLNLPVSTKCPNCRHFERMLRMNPVRLWDGSCAKCGAAFRTCYSPERPEIVYCEICFNAEMV
ncbi:MAG TPA: hypothetical protein VJL32_01585 [Candidatus Paceibacterota bacterium]